MSTHHALCWPGIIAAYSDHLPVPPEARIVTLGEGATPLLRATRLSDRLGLDVWLKYEGCNPTGSFKDRGMTVAITMALAQGASAVICASTGNTAASAAAYAARAGLRCWVVIPEGKVALGKLSQSIIHGARVVTIAGNFDRALELVREVAERHGLALVNSVNPFRIIGQQTAAFEICEALGDAPDHLVLPVGNAGNITAYWKGFQAWHAAGRCTRLPRMDGFQAAGAAPLVLGHPIAAPQTVATAIRIGNPASWEGAERARNESGGLIDCVEDTEILEAYHLLAREEGVFCEPASAAPVAGLLKMSREGGRLRPHDRVVCVLTGHGLKDPATATQDLAEPPRAIEAEIHAIEALITGESNREIRRG